MSETVKRKRIRIRTVEKEVSGKWRVASSSPLTPDHSPFTKLGACTLITLAEHTSEFDQNGLDLLRRAIVGHYRRERDSGDTSLPYAIWRREREKQAREQAVTALERAIVEIVE